MTHVVAAKHSYFEHAFTDRGRSFAATAARAPGEREALLAWMAAGQRLMLDALAGLDDAALAALRPVHWGGRFPLRRVLAVLIEHDLYHAGEINYLRA